MLTTNEPVGKLRGKAFEARCGAHVARAFVFSSLEAMLKSAALKPAAWRDLRRARRRWNRRQTARSFDISRVMPALVAGIHVVIALFAWMAGTSPAMTRARDDGVAYSAASPFAPPPKRRTM